MVDGWIGTADTEGAGVKQGTWMREHGKRGHRRVAALAATLVVAGVTLAGMGSATAAPRPSQFVIVKFLPSLHEVTLTIPTPPCKHGPPGCVWRLWVNEPFAPGAPVLGSATGTSGVLTVTYPSTVCGTVQGDASVTLQADVSVGGQVWRYKVGHRMTIPCTPTSPTTHPPTATTHPATAPDPKSSATTQLPFTGGTATTTTGPTTPAKAVQTAAITQLPFTGIDLKPMVLMGMALILAGLLLASRLEQRRRALHRLHIAARVQRERASRASRWFLGQ